MRQNSVVRLAAVLAGVFSMALAAWGQQMVPATMPVIPTTPEKISDAAAPTTIHGWHSSRLVKHDRAIYASVKLDEGRDPNSRLGAIFRREATGRWVQVANWAFEPYTMMVDPRGRFWVLGFSGPGICEVRRSGEKADLSHWDVVYKTRSTHPGAAISPEGNVLCMFPEHKNGRDQINCAFYDAQADKWHATTITGTPAIERRYGYEAIFMHGRTATVIMQSYNAYGPDGNSKGEEGVWRFVRVARCDDLTKGQWEHKLILGKRIGRTYLYDAFQAADGKVYLTYWERNGDTQEEFDKNMGAHMAVIDKDLNVETRPVPYLPGKMRFHVDSIGKVRVIGQRDNSLYLWDAELSRGLDLSNERRLVNSDMFTGYQLHTLRAQRYGGQDDDAFIYAYSTDTRGRDNGPTQPLWFLSVPVGTK